MKTLKAFNNNDIPHQHIIDDEDGTTIEFGSKQFRFGVFFSNEDDSESGFYYVIRHEEGEGAFHEVTWDAGNDAFLPKIVDKFREVLEIKKMKDEPAVLHPFKTGSCVTQEEYNRLIEERYDEF